MSAHLVGKVNTKLWFLSTENGWGLSLVYFGSSPFWLNKERGIHQSLKKLNFIYNYADNLNTCIMDVTLFYFIYI